MNSIQGKAKNLGQVAGLIKSNTPPSNLGVLWNDSTVTSGCPIKFYNPETGVWEVLGTQETFEIEATYDGGSWSTQVSKEDIVEAYALGKRLVIKYLDTALNEYGYATVVSYFEDPDPAAPVALGFLFSVNGTSFQVGTLEKS